MISFLILVFIFILMCFLYFRKRHTKIEVAPSIELTKVQKDILTKLELGENLFDISSTQSLVEQLKNNKTVPIEFVTDTTSELYLMYEASLTLATNSIFRKIVKATSVKESSLHFTLDWASSLFTLGNIVSLDKNHEGFNFKLTNITATTPSLVLNTLQDLKNTGRLVGDWYAQYENNIFLALLNTSRNKVEFLYLDSLCSLYSELLRNSIDCILILPEKLKDEFFILEEEIRLVKNIKLYPIFIEEKVLLATGCDFILIENDNSFKIGLYQNDDLKCAGMLCEEDKPLVQSTMQVGYYISGQVSYKLCKLEDGAETKIINLTIQ